MSETIKPVITVETLVERSVEQVWDCWTKPEHITRWNFASDDWHCPSAENDLQAGGRFSSRMEARDGSFGFDFWGTHQVVEPLKRIESVMGDDRKMSVEFIDLGGTTKIVEAFEAESQNPLELQQQGWQMILNNFKKHAESDER